MSSVERPAGSRTVDELLAAVRSRIERVSPPEAWNRLRAGALLVDTRPAEQRDRDGEVPGAAAGATTSVSGSGLTTPELVVRTLLALTYAMFCMLGVAAIALFLSTVVRSPLAAALGTMGFLIASTLLLTLDAADSFRGYLPTRYWLAFVDLFRDPILWDDVVRGLLVQLGYLVVFSLAAWANFSTSDVDE